MLSLSPLSSSCLTSDLLGTFALWPLAHYLMSLSFFYLICEMGMLIPAPELLQGLSESCGWSTHRVPGLVRSTAIPGSLLRPPPATRLASEL